MDIHFNAYKVRYDLLDNFFRPIVSSRKINTTNIFINLDDVFHTLHRPMVNQEFQLSGVNASKQLIANIINLMGHYKNWVVRNRVECRIYAVYTSTIRKFKNSIYIPGYRKKFTEHNDPNNGEYYFINEAIRGAMGLLKIMCDYVEDVYVIDSKYVEPSVIPLYISEEICRADWNIIISRDVYDLQYAYKDKWSFISPKGENSRFINKSNLWEYVNERERVYKEPGVYLNYDYSLFPIARAIVGDTYRGIPRLKKIGWRTLFKHIDNAENSTSKFNSSVAIQDKLIDLLEKKSLDINALNDNLYAVNIENQLRTMNEIDKNVINDQIVDIPDYENLLNITNTYFQNFPVNLHFLSQQYKKANKSPFG